LVSLTMQGNSFEGSNKTTRDSNDSRPIIVSAFTLCSLLAIAIGWQIRDEYYLSAESGVGYFLGIAGGVFMLMLLLYPLRKRLYPSNSFLLSIKNWFKLHMALGIIGPICILYHCNFGLGSTNSNVALASMLLMVSSGLVGRFIYRRIHFGLYGEKITLQELQRELVESKELLAEGQDNRTIFDQSTLAKIKKIETQALRQKGLLRNFTSMLTNGIATRWEHFRIRKELKLNLKNRAQIGGPELAAQNIEHLNTALRLYFSTLRKIAGLSFYERLFSMWHMLHLPIFFMLIATGLIHVYAVHAY